MKRDNPKIINKDILCENTNNKEGLMMFHGLAVRDEIKWIILVFPLTKSVKQTLTLLS